MALPTSTIVMAVLTAVPFGLAIKDTVTGTPTIDTRSEAERLDDEANERMDRAQREYAEQEGKKKAELRSAIDALIPMSKPATVVLVEQERLEDIAHAVFTPADGANPMTITFPEYRGDESVCSIVSERLDEAWGTAQRTYSHNDTRKHYAEIEPQRRATFVDPDDDRRCELIIEPYVRPSEFVNKTETSIVPLWALGKPAQKLVEKLGGDAFSDATQIRWTKPGLGLGIHGTELFARVVKGKIVTITARFETSSESIGQLAEQLATEYGAPPEADPVVWKKAKITLATIDDSAGEYLITVGDPLPEEE